MTAGIEHSPDDFQLTVESGPDQNEGSIDGTVLDQTRNKSNGKRKAGNLSDSSSEKTKKSGAPNDRFR